MTADRYILKDKKPVACPDLREWGTWLQGNDRIVKQEDIGDVRISTVFLGLDHSFGTDLPILFETMIFGGKHDGYQTRCYSWDEAEEMHKVAVALVKGRTILDSPPSKIIDLLPDSKSNNSTAGEE